MPTLKSEMENAPVRMIDVLKDFDEALAVTLTDLGRIARGEIKDTAKYARESILAANSIMVPR